MTQEIIQVVLIDDDRDDFILIRDLLRDVKYPVYSLQWISDVPSALDKIEKQDADVYLIDYNLGERTGLEILARYKDRNLKAPMILLTGHDSPEVDRAAMKEGAADFLSKTNITSDLLERSIRYSLKHAKDKKMIAVTERLKAEKDSAKAANRAKSQFLANMSHEIRSPLTAILGFAELARKSDTDPTDKQQFLDIIKWNSDHLLHLINDILDLSKVEAGCLAIESKKFNWRETISEIIQSVETTASSKDIHLHFADVQTVSPILTNDPLRFRQILLNMISNAVKFTHTGSVTIEVSVNSDDRQLVLLIRDTGIGISASDQNKLFQPYAQANSGITKTFGGTGLGLDLSRRLSRLMGGDLVLTESRTDVGSLFTLTLATKLAVASVSTAYSPPTMETSDNAGSLPRKVLVVEDTVDNQILISHLLKSTGIELSFAANGLQGIEKAIAGDFDAILMDIQMPSMDGYSATRLLRAKGYARPIIALSAYATIEDKQRALKSGFNDYVVKPIQVEQVLSALRKSQQSQRESCLGDQQAPISNPKYQSKTHFLEGFQKEEQFINF